MTKSLSEIKEILKSDIVAIIGEKQCNISGVAPIQLASNDMLTFCKKATPEAINTVKNTKASVVICPNTENFRDLRECSAVLILVDNPRLSFIRVTNSLSKTVQPQGIHQTAIVHPEAQIDPTSYIGPYCIVGKCKVGRCSVLQGHVTLYDETQIGDHVIIHSHTVIGTDGFGYERDEETEKLEKFPHLGGVKIGDHVEIGSNTSIDRGTLDDTIIEEGVKIDNQIHIAHNVTIGKNSLIIAQAMIAGSVKIGKNAWVAPGALILNGVRIGNDVTVGMGAVVLKDIPDGVTVAGAPARLLEDFQALLRQQLKLIRKKNKED